MKVILFNGSPNEKGCTYTALAEVEKSLSAAGVETEIFFIGRQPVKGCIGCGACAKPGEKQCAFDNDAVYRAVEKAKKADGFVFGSPVHYAGMSAVMKSFMDHFFYVGRGYLANKPAAAVVSCRRGGATAALEQLSQYCQNNNMPIITAQYWNMVHGTKPEEVAQDEEGTLTMRTLGSNLAWILQCIAAGQEAGVCIPQREPQKRTNFIR